MDELELEKLEQRIPIITDKALINLVNGIQVSRNIIEYRKSQGFFGSFFDKLVGNDIGRRILLDGNLIEGQQALCDWILELTNSVSVSQVALAVTQNSLLEARNAIRRQKKDFQMNISGLNEKLDKLEQRLISRINDLELKVDAKIEFDEIITRWEAGRTYTKMPWVIQVIMIIREVFSSSVIKYEINKDDKRYRDYLINKIIINGKKNYGNSFSLSDLLDLMCQDFQNKNDLELSLAILETRSLEYSRIQRMPLMFTTATTLELASLPQDTQPNKLARCAIALCRSQVQNITLTTDIRNFLTQITDEIANDCIFSITKNYED